jgi:hypothetical protein
MPKKYSDEDDEDDGDSYEKAMHARDGKWLTGTSSLAQDTDGNLYIPEDEDLLFPACGGGGATNLEVTKEGSEIVLKQALPNNDRIYPMRPGVRYMKIRLDYPGAYKKCVRCGATNPSRLCTCASCHSDPNNK